jgi:hypothetical protein
MRSSGRRAPEQTAFWNWSRSVKHHFGLLSEYLAKPEGFWCKSTETSAIGTWQASGPLKRICWCSTSVRGASPKHLISLWTGAMVACNPSAGHVRRTYCLCQKCRSEGEPPW